MTTIEDRLSDAAGRLRREVDRTADLDEALARTLALAPVPSPLDTTTRRRLGHLLVAAALLAVGVLAAAVFVGDDQDPVVTDGEVPRTSSTTSTTAAPATDTDIPSRVVGEVPTSEDGVLVGSPQRPGSISYAGIHDAFQDQWLSVTDQPVPVVDFEQEIVLMVTVAQPALCRTPVTGLAEDQGAVTPAFEDPPAGQDCGNVLVTRTFALAVVLTDLPRTFTLVLPPGPDGSYAEQRLVVNLAQNAQVHVPPSSDGGPPVDGPDLQAPAPGREITFDGMGEVRLGQLLDPSEVEQFEGDSSCGHWGPQEPSHDGDEPPSGLVSGADGSSPRVWTIMAWRNSIYRTTSGVGVGTTLATLERIYGDRLVVDRTDQNQSPTGGLVAWYQDVAAVRHGDNALTFYLSGDVVSTVKLSPADFWGDDEGCA